MNSSKPRLLTKLKVRKINQNKNNKNKNMINPLAQCVFHPFDGPNHKLTSLPDGDNSNRLMVDHSTYTDFTINSGGVITIRVMPTLPFLCLYQPTAGTVYTAIDPILGTASGTYGSLTNNVWSLCNSVNQYSSIINTNNINTTVVAPYSQTKTRIISLAWRIIYTGTVSNGNGMVTCRDLPINFDTVTSVASGGLRYTSQDNTAAAVSTAVNTAAIADYPTGAGGLDVGKSVFTRLDSNPWGIVKKNSRLYNWFPFIEQPFTLLPSSVTAQQIVSSPTTPLNALITNSGGTLGTIGLNYYSGDFNSTEIRVSGISATVSFRLEVKACVEYMVLPSSPVYSLTKTPAKINIKALDAVQEKASTLAPALDQNTVITNPSIERPNVALPSKSDLKQMTNLVKDVKNLTMGNNNTNLMHKVPQNNRGPRPKN